MKLPTAPLGIEMLAHDDGVWLIVNVQQPWWAFWRTTRYPYLLDKCGMIWLYQTLAKYLRHGVVDDGYDELAGDLGYSLKSQVLPFGAPDVYELTPGAIGRVARLMNQKGWVKM